MRRSASGGIVMVAYTYYPWDPRVRREAETLARRGHSVSVICCRDSGEAPTETVAGVRVQRLPLSIARGGRLRYLFQYAVFFLLSAARLRGMQAAAVHVHSLPDFLILAGVPSKARGASLTLDLHEAFPEIVRARFPRSRVTARLALVAEKMSCLVADHVIVVNETIRELVAARSASIARITVLYNSPDLASLPESPVEIPVALGELRLVYAGTVDPERDLETLIRAVAALRSTLPTSLTVYGRGDPRFLSYLEGLAAGLGIGEYVQFGGVLRPDRVLAHLAHCDVGVVTYVRSPITEVALPNKVFEYVALDKPLVLPDLRAMRRAFADAAWFYAPGDPMDLAAKIRAAASGGAEADSRRRRARITFEGARWEAQADRLTRLYPLQTRGSGGTPCT